MKTKNFLAFVSLICYFLFIMNASAQVNNPANPTPHPYPTSTPYPVPNTPNSAPPPVPTPPPVATTPSPITTPNRLPAPNNPSAEPNPAFPETPDTIILAPPPLKQEIDFNKPDTNQLNPRKKN